MAPAPLFRSAQRPLDADMDAIKVSTYADFKKLWQNPPSAMGSGPVFYVDLTGTSGPFLIYGVAATSNGAYWIASAKFDAAPGSFGADFPSALQLQGPLEFS